MANLAPPPPYLVSASGDRETAWHPASRAKYRLGTHAFKFLKIRMIDVDSKNYVLGSFSLWVALFKV
jgi:hypothetical protein